jgi:hypothetical protein
MDGMNTYELDKDSKEQEKTTIKQIMTKNKYETRLIDKLKNPRTDNIEERQKIKWATFSYNSKETKWIAKLFKDSPINISYTTKNTIKKAPNQKTKSEKEPLRRQWRI